MGKKKDARADEIVKLAIEGYAVKEIAEKLLVSNTLIYKRLREAGVKAVKKIEKPCKLDHEAIRKYYEEGHTAQETANYFSTSRDYVRRLCKGIRTGNQYTNGLFDREANAIRYITERTPQFEYAGNYTGIDGFVDLKCKTCGSVITKSFVSVRHGHARCDVCRQKEIDAYREKKKAERAKQAEEERQNRPTRKYKRLFEADIKQLEFPTCECCGNIFIPRKQGTKYCSELCMKRIANASHKDRRIKKLKHIVIDKDITLEKLYNRDDGVCYICGQRCDWNDYEVRDDGTFIAFDNYPSIDHIEPISKGGLHSWDNVRLACRKCNYLKRDSISPRSA